jgi:hypothetical protein
LLELRVRTHFLEELQSGHRLHVPVADHQAEIARAQASQRVGTVRRLVDIVEIDLLLKIPDDAQHRLVVIHDQHIHGTVDAHFCSFLERDSCALTCHPRAITL